MAKKADRMAVLKAATDDVADREGKYGPPIKNYERLSSMMSLYMEDKGEVTLEPIDAIMFQVFSNVARLMEDPTHKGSWDNLAGYAAIGYEVANG